MKSEIRDTRIHFGKGYNEQILSLARTSLPTRLILADFSADSIGRACGDQVQVDVAVSPDM
jgi:hypothetical protein